MGKMTPSAIRYLSRRRKKYLYMYTHRGRSQKTSRNVLASQPEFSRFFSSRVIHAKSTAKEWQSPDAIARCTCLQSRKQAVAGPRAAGSFLVSIVLRYANSCKATAGDFSSAHQEYLNRARGMPISLEFSKTIDPVCIKQRLIVPARPRRRTVSRPSERSNDRSGTNGSTFILYIT